MCCCVLLAGLAILCCSNIDQALASELQMHYIVRATDEPHKLHMRTDTAHAVQLLIQYLELVQLPLNQMLPGTHLLRRVQHSTLLHVHCSKG